MAGWIKIYRSISDHWVFQNDSYLKAWITILITVNHEPKKVLIHGELINCDRGQSVFSLASWVKAFGRKWSIQRVRTLFSLLENDNMIVIEGLQKTTRLTVCKYEDYQNGQQTTNRQITDNQQQLKNVKNEKKINMSPNGDVDHSFEKSILGIIQSIKSQCEQKTLKDYKINSKRIRMIAKRKKEFHAAWGADRDFFKACQYAFQYKAKEWFGKDVWQHFIPETLLSDKFVSYLEKAEQDKGEPYMGEPKKKEEEKVFYQIPK